MSCHGCARSFGFLTKEYGCIKCGFSFCSKCLVNKTCKSCITNALASSSSQSFNPTVDISKQLEKLEVPKNQNPIIVYTENQKLNRLKRGLSVEDQELVNRLTKLKSEIREIKKIPTQDEIEERLAKLKGLDPEACKQPVHKPVNYSKQSNIDPVTDLINQVQEEIAIDKEQSGLPKDSVNPATELMEDNVEELLKKEAALIEADAKIALENLRKDEEIQERLRKLRLGRESNEPENIPVSAAVENDIDSEDEEKQVRSILDRVVAETKLELGEADDEEVANDDELPWCELCNEDAQLRCLDCDDDLYCRRCWKETHYDFDLKHHRVKEYKV